jgi:hypothetical protein
MIRRRIRLYRMYIWPDRLAIARRAPGHRLTAQRPTGHRAPGRGARWRGLSIAVVGMLAVIAGFSGCNKKSADVVIVSKEHIPPHVPGTPESIRETDQDQWMIDVQFANGNERRTAVDAEQWKTFKVGERVHANYSEGEYTHTVWAIDLHKL